MEETDSRRAAINRLTDRIIGAAIEVHKTMGPGLLERVYEECLAIEFESAGIPFERQKPVKLTYKGRPVGVPLRVDFLADSLVVVELKVVDFLLPIHQSQLITYLKLTQTEVGLLINFNVPVLKQGIKRMINPSFPKT